MRDKKKASEQDKILDQGGAGTNKEYIRIM